MEKFFSLFGKVVLVLLVVGGAAGAAFYFGRQSAPAPEPNATETAVETATPSPTPQASDSATVVTAGLDAESGLTYGRYTIAIPAGWTYTDDKDETTPTDTLTIAKGGYSIKIYQAATGGAMCLYPGDPAFEGPSSSYDTFAPITTGDGTQLRRSGTNAASGTTRGFTGCQKAADSTYQQPTHYGHMQYTVPLTFDKEILTEMDAMVASLTKI